MSNTVAYPMHNRNQPQTPHHRLSHQRINEPQTPHHCLPHQRINEPQRNTIAYFIKESMNHKETASLSLSKNQ
jgi:hypothetical protein